MIRVVTIEREYGTGATRIADALALHLRWKLWDRDISAEIARRLRCNPELVEQREERIDSMFYGLLKVFMRGSFEAQVETKGLELLDADHIAALFETVIEEIAEKGQCVILGRGAPWFLRGREDTFHVFLYAAHEEKVRRIVAQGQSRRAAEGLVESVDRQRLAFVRKYYGKEWPDRHLYNMMLNTGDGDEQVIETILERIEKTNSGGISRGGSPD